MLLQQLLLLQHGLLLLMLELCHVLLMHVLLLLVLLLQVLHPRHGGMSTYSDGWCCIAACAASIICSRPLWSECGRGRRRRGLVPKRLRLRCQQSARPTRQSACRRPSDWLQSPCRGCARRRALCGLLLLLLILLLLLKNLLLLLLMLLEVLQLNHLLWLLLLLLG